MKNAVVLSLILLLGALNTSSSAQSQDAVAKNFAGMWRLVSNPQRLADGTTKQGANSVAYVFFDAHASHMCFISMNPNRPLWKSETAPTPEEGLLAIRGFGAYCATIEIHSREGFIARRYEIDQDPDAVGKMTKRWYTFQGKNRMTLRVDASELNPPVVDNTLVWERAEK